MLQAIIRWSLHNRLLVFAAAVGLLGLGLYEARHAAIDVFPQFAPPQVAIQTEAPGFAPLQVEQQVTVPLELTLLGLANVQDVRSTSIAGLSVITVIFSAESDIWTDRQQVAQALAAAANLPPTAGPARLAPVTSAIGLMEVVGFTRSALQGSSDVDPYELRTFAEWLVRPRLLAIPGVANVTIYGGDEKQYQIVVSPTRLRDYALTLDQILAATRASSALGAGGFFETPGQDLVIHAAGQIDNLDQLRRSVVTIRGGVPITLGDVGDIRFGSAPPIGGATINGQPAVVIQVFKQPQADTVRTTTAVDAALKDLTKSQPQNTHFYPNLYRQANFILASIGELKTAIWEGGLLVAVILLLFLRNLRTALISLTAIPLSLLAALVILIRSGASLNTMTLGGLVLALGEVVDDAIIDVENISRRLRQLRAKGKPITAARALEVVYYASSEVRSSVVYATLVVALVFLPIFFLTGIEGRIFTPIGEAYILSTLASLAVALTVTPALSLWLLPFDKGIRATDNRFVAALKQRYHDLIARTLTRPKTIGVASLAAAVVALAALPFMGGEFLPAFNEGNAVVHMSSVAGTSLSANLSTGEEVERRLLKLPEVASIGQRAGRAELGEDTAGFNYSEFDLRFKPNGKSRTQLLDEIRQVTADFPEFAWSAKQYISERMDEVLSGSTSAVAVKILGPDVNVLQLLATQVRDVMARVPGVADLQLQQQTNVPQVLVQFDRQAAQNYGLTSDTVAQTVQTAFFGATVGRVFEGQRSFDLVVRLPEQVKTTLDSLRATPVTAPGGTAGDPAQIPLAAVARVSVAPGFDNISRENGSRVMFVQSNVQGRDLVGFVDDLRARVARSLHLPSGYYIVYGGQFQSRAEAVRSLQWLGLAALAGILLLLYYAFRSWRDTLMIILNVPLAFVGGILAVFLTGSTVSIATLIGFVTLFGITVRNGIMLITRYQHLQREEGEAFGPNLVLRGARERLVPILMTALATGLALLPVVVGGNRPGRALEQPMAVVIVGGLLTSTVLNLIVVPTLFLRYGRPAAS